MDVGKQSLQGWARSLAQIGDALNEQRAAMRQQEENVADIAAAIAILREQGEQELPADPKLVSMVEEIHRSLGRLPAVSEVIGRIADYADTLWSVYLSLHQADEDRLAGTRGSVVREANADVSKAVLDT